MLLLAIPVMSVLTPVVEETCSRGLILQSLLPTGRWRAIFISSMLFTILHKPETYPTAFLFGLFAAVQALNWRSLWGPIITHGTFQFLVELDRTASDAFWLPGGFNGNPVARAKVLAISDFVCPHRAGWSRQEDWERPDRAPPQPT